MIQVSGRSAARGKAANMIYSFSLVSLRASTAAALVLALAVPVHAQGQIAPPAASPATTQPQERTEPVPNGEVDEYGEEGEAIVVTGIRRGSVVGDIPPQNVLGTRDVRATGATDITELLEAQAPQIGSARGRASAPLPGCRGVPAFEDP